MIDVMGLDVDTVTTQLNDEANAEWLENEVGKAKVLDGTRVGGGASRSALAGR